MIRFIGRNRDAVDNFAGRLATHSERHESLLARGYVVVRNAAAKVVTEAAAISPWRAARSRILRRQGGSRGWRHPASTAAPGGASRTGQLVLAGPLAFGVDLVEWRILNC